MAELSVSAMMDDGSLADYALELTSQDLADLRKTAKLAGNEQAWRILHNAGDSHPDSLADYWLEVTEDELETLEDAALDADGRKTPVKNARDILGVR